MDEIDDDLELKYLEGYGRWYLDGVRVGVIKVVEVKMALFKNPN